MPLRCERGQAREYVLPETGERFFSVSQVRKLLDNTYAFAKPEHLEAGRIRGNAVDRYLSFLLLSRVGCADVPVPVQGYEGYCESVLKWVEKHKVEPIRVQEPSFNRKLQLAGCPDAQVLYGTKRIIALPDLKTGKPIKTDGIQVLLYKTFEHYTDSKFILDVYAQADGSIAEEEERRSDPCAMAAAMGAVAILNWRPTA